MILCVYVTLFIKKKQEKPTSFPIFRKNKGRKIYFFPTLDLNISQNNPRNPQIFDPMESTLWVLQLSFFDRVKKRKEIESKKAVK